MYDAWMLPSFLVVMRTCEAHTLDKYLRGERVNMEGRQGHDSNSDFATDYPKRNKASF